MGALVVQRQWIGACQAYSQHSLLMEGDFEAGGAEGGDVDAGGKAVVGEGSAGEAGVVDGAAAKVGDDQIKG